MYGHDQHGGGQGTGCSGHFVLNNVNILDLMRNFTQEEYNSLNWNGGWDYVMQARERMRLARHSHTEPCLVTAVSWHIGPA